MTASNEPALRWMPARKLAESLRLGRLSAVEALEAHLQAIEEHNPALNAVVSMDPEAARRRAEAADRAQARGKVLGPLHGVPMTLKDAHDVAGLRTTMGTVELDRMADADGTVAARLRAAGANIVGHTNVAAWLADHQCANPVFGRTANPWDLERTSGGSSGGAAAALAAGLTPLEVGSDLVGSIRLPAHFCGVYGLKTTEHRVPLTRFFQFPDGAPRSVRIMSCLGPMARDLGDLELALGIIAGPDGADGDVPPVPLASDRAGGLAGLRLAVATAWPGVTVSNDLRERVDELASRASDAGAAVVERLPGVDWQALHELFGRLVFTVTSVLDPGSDLPDEQRTLAWYLEALDRRDALMATWQEFFEDHDALVVPSAITHAFSHRDPGSPIEVDASSVGYRDLGAIYAFSNLTGLPALAVPAGLDPEGLPAGVQIIGPLWSEMRLLAIARDLEAAEILPGFQAPPGF